MDLIAKVQEAQTESADLEFKSGFDPRSQQDWCEVIKDIVAIANFGGGAIVFGVSKDGAPSGADLSGLKATDPAVITDKLFKYLGQQFSAFRLGETMRAANPVVV